MRQGWIDSRIGGRKYHLLNKASALLKCSSASAPFRPPARVFARARATPTGARKDKDSVVAMRDAPRAMKYGASKDGDGSSSGGGMAAVACGRD